MCIPGCLAGHMTRQYISMGRPPLGQMPPPPGQTPTPRVRHPPGHTHPLGQTPPPGQMPPGSDTPQVRHPPGQTPPPGSDTPRVRHPPVNVRAVRILLECILVCFVNFVDIITNMYFFQLQKLMNAISTRSPSKQPFLTAASIMFVFLCAQQVRTTSTEKLW